MSNDTKVQEQDLRKLEDEAYFELRQIIAEAMQLQDVELLDARIASWKNKYKKLLDRPSTSSRSDFKKRIEFLLNEYYSHVTQYILDKLRLKEEKKIENQAKAMRELHHIIKNTNDYDLLKKKVSKWQEKYPINSFLRMYQKRIELYTRDKNLKENAFKQEEAFSDLVDITKKYATLDELNVMVEDWEKKYSINDKYSIDDFLKHQSEVKRFISDEFLQSIAREDRIIDNAEKTEIDVASEYNNKSFSNLSIQASSYAALLTISKSPNNINEMFKWVYENRHVKFNDKYKELILSATYLDYSPTYLNKLSRPDMDMSKSSLSYDEYNNISDIKRYAIISYFNLLLPPEKAISNDYFAKNVQIVYAKSEKARTTSNMEEDVSSLDVDEMLNSGIEISLENQDEVTYQNPNISEEIENDDIQLFHEEVATGDVVPEVQSPDQEVKLDTVTDLPENDEIASTDIQDSVKSTKKDLTEEDMYITDTEISEQKPEDIEFISKPSERTVIDNESNSSNSMQSIAIANIESKKEQTSYLETFASSIPIEPEVQREPDYDTVVALSPLFIEAVNNLDKQATIIDRIDSDATEYVQKQKTQELELSTVSKTKSDI